MTAPERLEDLMVRLIRRRRALPKDPELVALAERYFTGNARLSPVEQLEIYREQFWLRHTAALLEDFPGVSAILGQRAWERLCEEYLVAHPPSTFSLRDVGAALPAFVANEASWLEHQRLVNDMARLEWAYVEVFDAPGASAPLGPEKLAVDWDHARIVLSPALRLLRTSYPVPALRRRLIDHESANPIELPEPEPAFLLVHRPRLEILVEPLSEAEFALLSELADHGRLSAALEEAGRVSHLDSESLSSRLSSWFKDWVERSLIVDVLP